MSTSEPFKGITVTINPIGDKGQIFFYRYDNTQIRTTAATDIRFELRDRDANDPSGLTFKDLTHGPDDGQLSAPKISEDGLSMTIHTICTKKNRVPLKLFVTDGHNVYHAIASTAIGGDVDVDPEVINEPQNEDE